MVGAATDAAGRKWAFVWTREGGIVRLPEAGSGDHVATNISDAGDIVGTLRTTNGVAWVASENRANWGL